MVFWSLLSSKLLGNPGRWRKHKSSRDKCWPAQLAHAPGWLWMRCKRERPQWEREQNCAELQNQNQNNQVLRKNFFSWFQFETPLTILFGLILNGSCWERFWSKCSSAFIWLNHNSMYIFFCEASTKFGRWQEQVQCPSEIWSRAFQMDLPPLVSFHNPLALSKWEPV